MKKSLHLLLLALCFAFVAQAQNFSLVRTIQKTGTIVDGGATINVSSDDAEQENDEIDSLFDDDLDAGWEGAPEDQNILTVGLRFRDMYIPQGATIDSAYILFHSHEGKSTDDVARITIVGEATDHAETFTEDALIDARPQTSASALWEVAEEWEIYEPYRTTDISNVIQEIVDRDGWAAGNALSLILLGENQGPSDFENAREFESFENIADPADGGDGQHHPERIPMLFVYYTVNEATINIPIMATDTITDGGVTFAASSDDAEQENDEIDSLFDDDLDAGWEGAPEDQNILTVGLRFRNIPVPNGATIDAAYFIFHSHEGKSTDDVARITIVGDATDNAETFTEDALIDARPQTDASVLWEVAEEWEIYQPYNSADITPIVQELVDRNGWEAGNAMAFVLLGENQGPSDFENAREFESFENIADPADGGDGQHHPERVPQLVIQYSSPNSTSVNEIFVPAAKELQLFPNPVNDDIVTAVFDDTADAVINIYNSNGQLVNSVRKTVYGKYAELNVQDLPKGMYFVQAVQNNELYIQKLIRQ